MKLILDECIPRPFRAMLPGHDVSTVQQQGWAGVANGALLKKIADAGFDAFITMDRNLPAQQQLMGRPFAVIVLRAHSNRLAILAPLAEQILASLAEAKPGQVTVVSLP